MMNERAYHRAAIFKIIISLSIFTFIVYYFFNRNHPANSMKDLMHAFVFASTFFFPVEYIIKNGIGIIGGFLFTIAFALIVAALCSISNYFGILIVGYPILEIIYHFVLMIKADDQTYIE